MLHPMTVKRDLVFNHPLRFIRRGGGPDSRILALKPVVWLDAQREANNIAQGALTFLASDKQYCEADEAAVTAVPSTLACWFKTGTSASQSLVWVGDKSSIRDYNELLLNSNGSVAARSRTTTEIEDAVTAATTYDDDAWHLAVAVFVSATSRIIYIDDAPGVEQTETSTIGSTYDRTSIGRTGDSTPGAYHDGEISQPAFWNFALTSAQRLSMYNSGTMINFADVVAPIAQCFFNDPSRVKWEDRVGGLNMTAAGGTGFPTLVAGDRNDAASFASANTQRLEIDTAADTAYEISVALRFKSGSSAANQTMFYLGDKDSATEFLTVLLDTAGDVTIVASSAGDGAQSATVAGSFGDDAWHSLLAVWTNATIRDISVDGGSFTQDTVSVVIGATYDRTSIGRRGDSSPTLYMDGEIDEVMFFDSALTAANGTTLHNGGVPLSLQQVQSLVSPPKNHWSHDTHAPYLDAQGTLDLTPFGDAQLPVSAAGPNETQAVEGSALEQWVDRGSNGNTPVQSDVTKRPQLVRVPWANEQGYVNAIRFDGVDDALGLNSFGTLSQPFEAFTVARFISVVEGVENYVWADNFHPSFRKDSADNVSAIPGTDAAAGSSATGNYEIFNVEIDGTSTKIIRNGVTDASSGGTGTALLSNIIVGARDSSGTSAGNVDILEHLIFPNGLLSAAEKLLVLTFLRNKYNLHWGDSVLTGPALWFSASSNGIKTANDGSGNDVADTEAVGFWNDVSGNANHVSEPTTAQKPVFESSNPGFNNRPVVTWSTTQALNGLNATVDNGVGLTIISVANLSSSGAIGYLLIKASAWYIRVEADGTMDVALGTDDDAFAVVHNNVSAITVGTPFIVVYQYVSGTSKLFVGGAQVGSTVSTITGDILDTNGNLIVGSNGSSGANPWVGEMAEMLVFNRGLSDAELNAICNPLSSFYGVSWADI